LYDLHIWVKTAQSRGIADAEVIAEGHEPRRTSGDGHTHFPVTGPALYTIRAEGYNETTVDLPPGHHNVHLQRSSKRVELSPLRVESNQRWFRNDEGRFDWREFSAFALYGRWLQGQHSYCEEYARHMWEYGFTVARVLFTLDGDYWKRYRTAPDMPGFWDQLVPFIEMLGSNGLYTRACLLGALEPFGVRNYDWGSRPDVFRNEVRVRAGEFCVRFVSQVRDCPSVVLELANEPIQIGMRDSFSELVTIGRRVKETAPNLLLCGGSPDGANDQDVTFLREPFDFCDAHIHRLDGVGGFEWVKRTGEYMPIDQPAEHWPAGQPRKLMPFVSGEPINFGEARADGRGYNEVTRSTAVAFAYGAMSRARHYNTCFHYDGGLWATYPKPETDACIRAYMQGLDAFPMTTDKMWRGHWGESFFRKDIYPPSDDPRVVEDFVRSGRGPWRVNGSGLYAVTLAEPANWNYAANALRPVERLARVEFEGLASSVYRVR
jgi:hypothetical protein